MTLVAYDPLLDKSYRATTLGRDVADFLYIHLERSDVLADLAVIEGRA